LSSVRVRTRLVWIPEMEVMNKFRGMIKLHG